MSLPRFYIEPQRWQPDEPVLTGSEAHHARDVLRLKAGDEAILFNGVGQALRGEVVDARRGEVRFRPIEGFESEPRSCHITLAQCIPKGKNMDLIVQKAVELGAAEIVPLISERTVVSLDGGKDASKKLAKWQQIAIEAAKQCGQSWVPEIHQPSRLDEFLGGRRSEDGGRKGKDWAKSGAPSSAREGDSHSSPIRRSLALPGTDCRLPTADLRLIASLQPDALHLKEVLREYEAKHEARPVRVTMLIGPEGDLMEAEYAAARAAGFQPITLGSIILRVETAAIYCLSVLSYELLSRGKR